MTNPTGIRDCGLCWQANTVLPVSVPVTGLPAGTTPAAWSSFVLTIREDPCWPRKGAHLYDQVDPFTAGWSIIAAVSGTPSADVNNPTLAFTVAVPGNAGYKRYVVDVRGYGGPGEVCFYGPVWLSVSPAVGGP